MIKQGAVKCDSNVVSDTKLSVARGSAVWQVGKRKFARITLA
jgi:tyrosyl-tRNA synthetase